MASMSDYIPFLIWLLCVGLSAIFLGFLLKTPTSRKEGFAIHTCPSGTMSFVTREGETHCCNGDVVDGLCTGDLRCTLSPKSKSGLPTCSDLAASDAAAAGTSMCPPAMPNYFASTNIRGCSASQPTADGKAPLDPNQPQCILYPTPDLDRVKLDSCYNVIQANQKAATCAAAQATAALPACAAAASSLASSRAPPPPGCPPPPACPPRG